MRVSATTMHSVLWVLALVLLVVRTGDAHLHLCFDGQEPPRTLHVADDAETHDHEGESKHVDTDVSAMDAAIAKKSAQSSDEVALPRLATPVLVLLPPDRRIDAPQLIQNLLPARPYLFLPLLRGPPA